MFQKIISTILIVGLVLSLGFNVFLFKPKQAQALVDVIGGPSNILNLVKEVALDAVAWTIKDRVINVLKQKIMDWGMGRKSDAMQPFAVSDWVQYFKDAVALGAAKYITEFRRTKIEPEIKKVLENLGFDTYAGDLLEYHQYAESTLEKDLGTERYQRFKDSDYSLLAGGWNALFSLMKPQNNIFGQVLMAERARRTYEQAQKEAANKEVIGGSIGYKNETVTTMTDREQCRLDCAAAGPPSPDCLEKCEKSPGIAIQTQIKNWGSTIEKNMTDALGADMAKILQVDEISELLGIVFSALLNRAIDGMGLAFQAITAKPAQKTRAEQKEQFSYLRNFQKTQTPQQMQGVRGNVLNTILKAIQSLNRTGIYCKEDEMVKYTDWIKNVSDILHPSVESLYVGLTGANLQPDFEVLDPICAPYSVYGHSWGQVPASKFPDRCRKITDQLNLGINATCRNIKSGLEPNYNPRCKECMYDHDAMSCRPNPNDPVPPLDPCEISDTTIKAKEDFYNVCRGPYLVVVDRCDDCLKKVDEKCGNLEEELKNQCILNHCTQYVGIADKVISPPVDGIDFYNKCLLEEQKDACYTCLKEYYVPATYCEQVGDYVSRAIDKYPTVVKRNRSGGDDKGEFWGPKDEEIAGRGDQCNDNYDAEPMNLALLCRIMPDFSYRGITCRNTCMGRGMTEEQLRDITDFRPNDKDCNNATVSIGGRNPLNPINDGAMHTRGKCCATFWQHDLKKYATCIGAGPTTEEEPELPEDYGVCHDGIAGPDEGERGWAALTNMSLQGPTSLVGNLSHGFINVIHRGEAYSDCVILRSNREPFRGATIYITKPYCDAVREWPSALYYSDINDDQKFDDHFEDDITEPSKFLGYCKDSKNKFVDPEDRPEHIICKFDLDNAPLDSAGNPYTVCCGLNTYPRYRTLKIELDYNRKQQCRNAGISDDLCNKYYTNTNTDGLWIVVQHRKGGAELCVCEDQNKACQQKCKDEECR